jgi:hypothetical protein
MNAKRKAELFLTLVQEHASPLPEVHTGRDQRHRCQAEAYFTSLLHNQCSQVWGTLLFTGQSAYRGEEHV